MNNMFSSFNPNCKEECRCGNCDNWMNMFDLQINKLNINSVAITEQYKWICKKCNIMNITSIHHASVPFGPTRWSVTNMENDYHG